MSKTSFNRVAGQAGSESSDAIIDFSSSKDSCGLCIHINALITIARTYTHSHATVVRTTSINEANKLETVSFPLVPFDTEGTFRLAGGKDMRSKNNKIMKMNTMQGNRLCNSLEGPETCTCAYMSMSVVLIYGNVLFLSLLTKINF